MGKDREKKPIDLGGESTTTSGTPYRKSQVRHKLPNSLPGLLTYLGISSPVLTSGEPETIVLRNDSEWNNAFALALEDNYQKVKENRKWYSKALNALKAPIRYCQQWATGTEKKFTDLNEEEKKVALYRDEPMGNRF